jgi:hypothetical protein
VTQHHTREEENPQDMPCITKNGKVLVVKSKIIMIKHENALYLKQPIQQIRECTEV